MMMTICKCKIFACILIIGIFVSSAWGKMSVLKEIEDQFVRPNILVILDTSGSMGRDVNGIDLNSPDSEGRIQGDHKDSRMNIAKEVITNALSETREFANFGLMSFKQTHFTVNHNAKGYFPYLKPSLSTSGTATHFFPKYELDEAKFTVSGSPSQRANSGFPNFTPVNSFVYRGITYTLKSSNNSRYKRWSSVLKADVYADHDFNGAMDEFQDPDPNNTNSYTWAYQGSYYEYTKYDDFLYQLDHEIQYYNSSNGTLIAWVRLPVVYHDRATEFYIYYGKHIPG